MTIILIAIGIIALLITLIISAFFVGIGVVVFRYGGLGDMAVGAVSILAGLLIALGVLATLLSILSL